MQPATAVVLISLAVLLGTSAWLLGSVVGPSLTRSWGLSPSEAGWLTSSVQIGFVAGTLLLALSNLSDRVNPRFVFAAAAAVGAVSTAAFALWCVSWPPAVVLRFITGMSFAGIYPLAMQLVATWFRSGLGWRLGLVVGALVIGSSSPWLLRGLQATWPWRNLAFAAAGASLCAGLLVWLALPDGPHRPPRPRFQLSMAVRVFAHPPFRRVAVAYIGHMWELYALWAWLAWYLASRGVGGTRAPMWVFACMAAGGLGCVAGGWRSQRRGEATIARVAIIGSTVCCLAAGWVWGLPDGWVFAFVLVWGILVVADSPQFSALAAQNCPPAYIGTALTVQNCVGFAVSMVSIQLLPWFAELVEWRWALTFLAVGPALGAWSLVAHAGRGTSTPAPREGEDPGRGRP